MGQKITTELKTEIDKMVKDAKNVATAAKSAATEIKKEAVREIGEARKRLAKKGVKIEVKVDLGDAKKNVLHSDFKDPNGDLETWTEEVSKSHSAKYF